MKMITRISVIRPSQSFSNNIWWSLGWSRNERWHLLFSNGFSCLFSTDAYYAYWGI